MDYKHLLICVIFSLPIVCVQHVYGQQQWPGFFTTRPDRPGQRVATQQDQDLLYTMTPDSLTTAEQAQAQDALEVIRDKNTASIPPTVARRPTTPLPKMVVTSPFGMRQHPVTGARMHHNGVDLRAHFDTLYAPLDGVVEKVFYHAAGGITLSVRHGDFVLSYAHLSEFFVAPQRSVTAGQPMGRTGATGRVTGPHVHISVRFKDKVIDPWPVLKLISDYNEYE